MILKADEIAELLRRSSEEPDFPDPLFIVPFFELEELKKSGSASVDLRLGTWFIAPRQARMSHLDLVDGKTTQAEFTKTIFVPYGKEYFLHPRNFVLGMTIEWLRLPSIFAGYIVGKSSWGRCGLIIETAAGIHPGFTGCLTLELSNAGEVPIRLIPGMTIGQLFLHRVETKDPKNIDKSVFAGQRQPTIDKIQVDKVAEKLFKSSQSNQLTPST
jgi:dCTP deaminase